jgi:hypothetical protein
MQVDKKYCFLPYRVVESTSPDYELQLSCDILSERGVGSRVLGGGPSASGHLGQLDLACVCCA